MALEANRQTTLHIAKSDHRDVYATTLVTANMLYVSLAVDCDNQMIWFGTQRSPEEMDLMRAIRPATVFAADVTDLREVANYLNLVADKVEATGGDLPAACAELFGPKEEPVVEEKPKRKRGKKKEAKNA